MTKDSDAGRTGLNQEKQSEWSWQWSRFGQSNKWLFEDWIHPVTIEEFRDKTVCDAGCGPGHHVRFVSPYVKRVVAVDLNTAEIAASKTADLTNVEYVEADLATFDPEEKFDIVYSIGVVHHTNDPDRTAANLKWLVKPGGLLIFWVYSAEGNKILEYGLNPFKKIFLSWLPRSVLLPVSHLVTVFVYMFVYTLYRLPLRFLPFYEYFENWRKMTYLRNHQNVFDHMNSPVDAYIPRSQVASWMEGLEDVSITPYVGISWRASGRVPQ